MSEQISSACSGHHLDEVAAEVGVVLASPYAHIGGIDVNADAVLGVQIHDGTGVGRDLNGGLLTAQQLCLLVDKQVEACV